jgi:hypothetical protein
LFRPVTLEGLAHGHFVHCLVHGGNGRGRQRFGDVADAAADEAFGGFGVRVAKCFDAPGDLGKEITGFELEKIVVKECHVKTTG